MWLSVISVILNGVLLIAIAAFLLKRSPSSEDLDSQHKAQLDALHRHYQEEENKLQRQLAAQTRQVTDEIFALRRKLESDIQQELEKSKQYQYQEIESEVKYRIKLLKEQQKQIEQDIMHNFQIFKEEYNIQKQITEEHLESLKSSEASAVASRIRMYEELNKEKFYMIGVLDSDTEEIEELMEILPKLRNPAPLRKAIYEIYYRQPVKDMINRVVGYDDRPSGVYKVTYIDTGECYVGQSVDIGNRFMQHIRKGFGIDDYTNSKLYAAMIKYGLHKFKFEVVERCQEHLLNEKEKY